MRLKTILFERNEILTDEPLFPTQTKLAEAIIESREEEKSTSLLNRYKVQISRLLNGKMKIDSDSLSLFESAIKFKKKPTAIEDKILEALNSAYKNASNPYSELESAEVIAEELQRAAELSGHHLIFADNPAEVRTDENSKVLSDMLLSNLGLLDKEYLANNSSFKYNFFVSHQIYANKLWLALSSNLMEELGKAEIDDAENQTIQRLIDANKNNLLKVFICDPILTSIHSHTIIFRDGNLAEKIGFTFYYQYKEDMKASLARMSEHALVKWEELVYNRLFFDFSKKDDKYAKLEVKFDDSLIQKMK